MPWAFPDGYPFARESYLLMADSEAYLSMRETLSGQTCNGPLWLRAEVAVRDLVRHVERTEAVRVMVAPPPEWDAAVGAFVAVWDAAVGLTLDPADVDQVEAAEKVPRDAAPPPEPDDEAPTVLLLPADLDAYPPVLDERAAGSGDQP